MAEVDGEVELLAEKKRGKRTIVVRSETGIEREHLVPQGKRFLVHSGDLVKAGQSLIEGPLVPHDILRISGEEAVQQYLVHEVQSVYRSQRVEINDKHIEIIIARMLRKVKIENPGDTNLLPGAIMDRFDFRAVNENLSKCLRITHKGDSDFLENDIVPKEAIEQANTQIEALGGDPAKGAKPKFATASTQLLGITKAAVQSSSFISAASFQETTKVLTEAALAGKIDNLVGLKENVILGHLIPAGTGFRSFQESEVRINPQALEALAAQKVKTLEEEFPLLQDGDGGAATPAAPASPSPFASDGGGFAQQPSSPDAFSQPVAGNLEQLLGGGSTEIPAAPGVDSGALGGSSLAPATPAPRSSDFLVTSPAATAGDDLTKIEGIGPKVAELLQSQGIMSYTQLSAASPERLGQVLAGAGGIMATMDPSTWPAQAQMAAEGRWEDLQKWQDELQGGRGPYVPTPDDLTKVEGIGPKVQEVLNAYGVMTYGQLSATGPDKLREILTGAGGIMATMNPESWPAQAQMAAEGRWERSAEVAR